MSGAARRDRSTAAALARLVAGPHGARVRSRSSSCSRCSRSLAPVLPLRPPDEPDARLALRAAACSRGLAATDGSGSILGCDALGRCLLSRTIHGLGVSLARGARRRGRQPRDRRARRACSPATAAAARTLAVMRLVDVLDSVPLVFVVIFIQSFLRGMRGGDQAPGGQIWIFFATLGAVHVAHDGAARARRRRSRSANRGFIEAARALGASGRVDRPAPPPPEPRARDPRRRSRSRSRASSSSSRSSRSSASASRRRACRSACCRAPGIDSVTAVAGAAVDDRDPGGRPRRSCSSA